MAHHAIQYTLTSAENAGSVLLAMKDHQPLWQYSLISTITMKVLYSCLMFPRHPHV
jgi:hypothetical protein